MTYGINMDFQNSFTHVNLLGQQKGKKITMAKNNAYRNGMKREKKIHLFAH